MRKSFTRLFSIVMLFSMILLSAVAFGIGSGPVLDSSVPIDGFSNYDGRSGKLIVTLTFDQNVEAGAQHAGIIGLYFSGGQVDPIQVSGPTSTNLLTGSTVVINGKVVTVTFNRTMAQGETYYVTVSQDALMNSSSQYFAGLDNPGGANPYDITIGDFTSPTIATVGGVLNLVPRTGSNNVTFPFTLGQNLTATFSENVAFGTGSIGLYTKDGNIVELFELATDIDVITPATPAAGEVGIVGKTLYINPSNDLSELKEYYVRIAPTAIKDLSGNAGTMNFAGINNNTGWSFQAADITKPTVTFVPVNTTTNVQQGQIMKVIFTDNRVGKITSGFEVRKDVAGGKFTIGQDVSALVTFTENGIAPIGSWTAKYTAVNEITFAWGTGPNDKFVDHASYIFGILGGSFFDEEDNSANASSSTFSAGDFLSPVFTATTVAAGTSAAPNNVAADLETTKLFLTTTITVEASPLPVEVHYLIKAAGTSAPTSLQVMAGPVLSVDPADVTKTNHFGFASTDGAGAALASNTLYDVYFAAKDNATVPNTTSDAALVKVANARTNDILAPVPTAKVNTLTSNNVVVTAGAASLSNVKMDSPVTVTFDEPVTAVTANVKVEYFNTALATPAWVTLADGADYSFAFAANTVTITGAHADIVTYPAALWKSLGQYRVTLKNAGIADDLTGKTGTVNPISEKVYAFTIEDYTGPMPVFNGTTSNILTGVATSANIVVDLGEVCTRDDGTAIDNNNVFFRDVATGNLVPATVTVSGGRYITIDPTASLLDGNTGHNYSIELTASIKDASNNPLGYYKGGLVLVGGAAPQFLNFTTADEQRPVLTFTPANGTSGLNNNANGLVVNVVINETVKKADGSLLTASDANYLRTIVSVVKVSDNSPVNFDITGNTATTFNVNLNNFLTAYAANESYTVTVNGLFDNSGNLITDNSTTFSIREYTKPTITAYSPLDGSVLVAAAEPMKITFSEPVTGIPGQLITLYQDGTANSWTFDASTGTSIVGNVVTLVPGNAVPVGATPAFAGFVELGNYHIQFPAGCFEDAVHNLTDAAITNATTWNWSAFDATDPTILSVTPVNGTTVANPSQLVINFTEASKYIYAGAGSIYIREMGNTGIPDFTIPAQSAAVVITNNVANPIATISVNAATFKYNTQYWVEIDANAFRDGANHYFAGYVNNSALWNFTIQADPRPYYLLGQCFPTDGSSDIDLNATVKLKFSEPVWISSPLGKYLTFRNFDGTAQSTVYFDSPAGGWTWNAAHDELTVPHPDFLPNSSYYITVTDNTFTDSANQTILLGSPAASLGELTGAVGAAANLRFSTTDNIPPVVSSITVNGTDVKASLVTTPTGIAKNANILITFSEPVTIASADLNSCVQLLANGVPVAYAGTLVGQVLTINPSVDFLQTLSFPGVTVDVKTAVTNKIKDQATVPNWIATDVAIGKFVVVDYVNPSWDGGAISATAGNNKFTINNISINEAGKIYYYAVPAGTLSTTPSPATIKGNNTFKSVVDGDNTFDITGLLGDKAYDIYFTAEDLAGNLMDGTTGVLPVGQKVNAIMNVETLDNVAPLLLTSFNTAPFTAGLSPANGATCVDVTTTTTLKMKFNEVIGAVDQTKFWLRKASNNYSVATPLTVSAGGTDVVTITLTGLLADKTDYFVEIDPGAIQDAAGNVWGSYFYGNNGSWRFTTDDSTPPVLAVASPLTPANNSTGVAIGANNSLVIKFNEPIFKNTTANTYIDIYRVGTATPHERIDVSTDAVTVNGNTVTITRSNIYESSRQYYVLIPNNSFFDGSCNPNFFAGFSLTTDWTFTAADIIPPVVTWNPNGSAIVNSVIQGSTLTMHVNEVLYNGAAALNGSNLKARFLVANNSGLVTVSSAIYSSATGDITITLATPIASNNTYTVTYNSATTVSDQAGNPVPTSSVTFTTDDRLSPTVLITAESTNSTSPVAEVKKGTKFLISFNKPIVNATGGTINLAPSKAELETVGAYFTITPAVAYTVNVVAAGSSYEIVPNVALTSEGNYSIQWIAYTGVGGNGPAQAQVKDIVYVPNGNPMTGTVANTTFAFHVEDYLAPTANGFTPVGASSLLAGIMSLDFNEKVIANDAAGQIEIRYSNGQIFQKVNPSACDFTDVVAPFTVKIPHNPFEAYKGYYVVIPNGAFVDDSYNANAYAGFLNNTSWTFSTDDGVPPVVMSYTPVQNEQNVIVDANLVLRFSENIQLGAGNLVIYYNNGDPGADGNAMEIIPFNSPKVSISGTSLVDPTQFSNVLTVNPTMLFNALGEYYVRIDAGFVKDLSGNNYAGINDNATWKFGITDPTVPTLLLASNPANGATNVGATLHGVSMHFDRDILPGTGYIKLYQYNYNASTYAYETKLVESIDVNTVTVNHATNTVTFDVQTPLVDNMVYYFLANNGSFTNTATSHNWWGGISDPFAWRFTTGDNTAPTVAASVTVDPLATPNVFDVTLTFDEAVTGVDATTVTVSGGTMTTPVVVSPSVYKVTITALDLSAVKLSMSAGIKDLNNNSLVAQDVNYKVADNNPPTLTATPNGGAIATNVFTVNLVFNEPVVVPDGAITVNNGATVVVSGSNATYQALVTAQSNTVVTMSFANTIVDLAVPTAHPFVGLPLVFNVTGDAVAPTVVALSPADGTGVTPETGVVRNPNLAITFSEAIVPGTIGAKVKVYKQDVSAVNTLVSSTTINASMISADGLTLTVPVIDPLTDNTDYVVLVDAGIVKSLFGVNFAGINDPTSWNFKTGDNTAPILTITDNQANDLKTKQDILVTLQFNEPVWHVANAVSVTGATSFVVDSVSADVYTVAIKAADLANVSLTVSTAVTDRFDRNHLALPQTVNFTVGDNTAPTVAVTGSVVANTITATLTFDENVFGVASAITVTGITGEPVITGADGGMNYTVTMSAVDGASVKVLVANTIADASGNTFAGGQFGPFVVGDNTAPTATVVPADGATNLKNNFTVEVTFNEAVTVPDGAITVTGGTAVVTAPESGNTYSVAINAVDHAIVTLSISNAVKDASNNLFAGATYTYTVGDNTAPTAVVDPVSGTTGLKNTFTVDVTFNETVTVPEGAISVSDNATATIKAPVSGNTYTVTITAADSKVVTLNVSNAVKDASGNAFAGESYTYTVGDNTAPFVIDGGYSPADGDMNLGSHVSLKMTFNEDVLAASATSEIKVYEQTVSSTNTLVFHSAITSDMISGNVVTIPINYVLKDNTSYTVLVDNGIVKDASGNVFATGFTDPTRWNFQIGDNTAPTVTVTPASASAARNPFDVTIKFSEPVVNVNSTTVTVDKGQLVLTPVGTDGTTYKATISAADGVVVTLTIGTGIKDVSLRNSLAAAVTNVYTIGDNTAPTLTVTPPVAPIATVFTVGLKFNEAVSGLYFGGSAVTVSNGKLLDITGSGDTYTLTVSGVEMATVTIVLNEAIVDASGNKFAGVTLNYTIGDFTAPGLVSMTPTLDNVLANNHPTFKMTFSENVKLGAGGNLVVYKVNTTTPLLTIAITANMVSGKDVTVDYTTVKGLDVNTRYYVLVDGTALTDVAGNAFEGVSDVAAWTFKTGNVWVTPNIEPNSSPEFKVYPNPFVDVVNVISSSKLSKIVVTNIAGQIVKEVVNPTNNIQLNELRSGIYFISLYDMDNVVAKTAKIVKR